MYIIPQDIALRHGTGDDAFGQQVRRQGQPDLAGGRILSEFDRRQHSHASNLSDFWMA